MHSPIELSGGGSPGPGTVTNAMLAPMPARSVKVNATNAAATPQDLQGVTPLTYLRVNAAGTALEFGDPEAPGAIPLTDLVNATAQFDIIGRKTAGAGAWEDCTRTQLQLPGLPDANVFTSVNTFNQNSSAAPGAVTGITTIMQVVGPDSAQTAFIQDGFAGVTRFLGRRANGTSSAKTAIGAGQGLAVLASVGHDGTNYTGVVAQIVMASSEAFDPTHNGSEIQFATVSLPTTALNTRIHIRDGLYTHNATGGDKGADTVNASALYEAGVLLTAKYAQLGAANTFTAFPQTISINTAGLDQVILQNSANPAYYQYYNAQTTGSSYAIGGFLAYALNSTPAKTLMGGLITNLTAKTAGAESGQLVFYTTISGSFAFRLLIDSGVRVGNAVGGDPGNGNLSVLGTVRIGQFTVATLPSATTAGAGALAFITDGSAVPVYNAVATGGGTNGREVVSDGTNWRNS